MRRANIGNQVNTLIWVRDNSRSTWRRFESIVGYYRRKDFVYVARVRNGFVPTIRRFR